MDHVIIVKASAAQKLKDRTQESKVHREPFFEAVIELLPFAKDVENHCHNIGSIHVTVNQTFFNLFVLFFPYVLIRF